MSFVVFFRFYREIFKTIRQICSEINFPDRELKKINASLQLLKRKQWISDEGISAINETIKEQMAKSEIAARYAASKMLKNIIKTGGRERTDPLVVCIILMFLGMQKVRTNEINYQMAAAFLSTHGLIDGMTDDTIRKIHKRNKLSERSLIFRTFWHAAAITQKNQLPPNSIPHEYEDIYNKLIVSSFNLKSGTKAPLF